MKTRILITLFFLVSLKLLGQQGKTKDCYEVKYLDLFGFEGMPTVKWPDSEIESLMNMYSRDSSDELYIKSKFTLPILLYQMKDYHPKCNKKIDKDYFDKIVRLYFLIGNLDITKIEGKSVAKQIDFIRDDFYARIGDEANLHELIFTLDDGPIYGKDYLEPINTPPSDSISTEFGSLSIFYTNSGVVLVSKDKNGVVIWQKVFTRFYGDELYYINLSENPIHYNTVTTCVYMNADGERLTLYLNKKGQFLFYYHSW